MKEFDLSGKKAIVTGASRGLGQYMSLALARAGADLILTSRNSDDTSETRSLIEKENQKAYSYALDVEQEESIKSFTNRVRKDHSRVDILVNNAGCNVRKSILNITWNDWNKVLNTNLRGTFFVSQGIAPMMIEQGKGKIINIGSITSVFGFAGIVPYCASRGGVLQMSKAMADEWASHGINVNVLAPGWFRTKQTDALYQDKGWYDYICDRIPMHRPGKPNDLDGTVVFLSSDASDYITGQILFVDGGVTTGSTKANLEV